MSHVCLGWAESGSARKEKDLIQGNVCEVCSNTIQYSNSWVSQPLSFAGEILIKSVMDEPLCGPVLSISKLKVGKVDEKYELPNRFYDQLQTSICFWCLCYNMKIF